MSWIKYATFPVSPLFLLVSSPVNEFGQAGSEMQIDCKRNLGLNRRALSSVQINL